MKKPTEQLYPDVRVVRAQAKRDWLKQRRTVLSIQERIGESVPWWVVIIALVFFLLSVPHTMVIFDKITPTFGYVAPFGVEFGLLYGSFRRKLKRGRSVQLYLFEIFLFFIAVVVNGAGSFEAVVQNTTGIGGMSITDLIEAYPTLPATSQVALFLAPLAALIIPIGTAVAGEGLATLLIERQVSGNRTEEEWETVKTTVEFEALRDAAINAGIRYDRAIKWAADIAGHELPDTVSVSNGQDWTSHRTAGGHGTGRGYTKNMDARQEVWDYLETNPDAAKQSIRTIADQVSAGKSTVAAVLNEWQASRNGHGTIGDDE